MTPKERLFAAADARKATSTPPPAPAPIDIKRGTRYAIRALEQECEILALAPEGQRDHAINQAAFRMGTLIGAGILDEDHAVSALRDAARRTGQPEHEINRALRHGSDHGAHTGGIERGKASPRALSSVTGEATDGWPEPPGVTVLGEPVTDITDIKSVDIAARVKERLPILDWHELWARETTEDWIIEPLLPARRLVALYSAPKVGKSLLMLELAVAIARGTSTLGVTPDRPRRVLYVDFENDPEADIRERLQAMQVAPDQLDNLCYLSFPTMAHLDTEAGSLELLAAAEVYDCEVVVIDTVSRSVGGDENENDTWLNFYRHTGMKLKKAQKALIRLDHTGKDETKGQRGGSAKVGDVDAVWKMSRVTDTTYRLDCEAHRFPLTEKTLVLHRQENPLRHTVDAEGRYAAYRAKVDACLAALDAAGAPAAISNSEARDIVREAGVKVRNEVLAEALRRRKLMSGLSFPDERGTQDEIAGIDTSRERLGNGGAA